GEGPGRAGHRLQLAADRPLPGRLPARCGRAQRSHRTDRALPRALSSAARGLMGVAAPRGPSSTRRSKLLKPARAMTESRSAASHVGPAEEPRSLRVALSPYLFRGMLVGMGAVAVGIHRLTRNRQLAWGFAKARARTLERMLGVRVQVAGLEH